MCEKCEQFKSDLSKDSFPTGLSAAIFVASIANQAEPTDREGNTPSDVYKAKRVLISRILVEAEDRAAEELGAAPEELREENSSWSAKIEDHLEPLVDLVADALEEFITERAEKAREYMVQHMGQAEL